MSTLRLEGSKAISPSSAGTVEVDGASSTLDEPFLRDLQLAVRLSNLLDAAIATPSSGPHSRLSCVPSLPLECIERILRWTQMDEETPEDLRNFSLVSPLWAKAAQRVLFGQLQRCVTNTGIRRLRESVITTPEIGKYIRKIDLGSPEDRWEPKKIKDYFRRASGLLRDLPNLRDISILHIALGDPIRDKFFGALASLPSIRSAAFDSSCWSGSTHTRQRFPGTCPDIEALVLILCRWRKLRSLTLHGYSHYPRILSPSIMPAHTLPTYKLKSLEITSSDMNGAEGILWLLGSSRGSLRSLTLSSVTGLSTADYSALLACVAPGLQQLQLSVDADDLVSSSMNSNTARALDPAAFAKMERLETLVFTTDLEIRVALLATLAQLKKLNYIGFNCPNLSYNRAVTFVRECQESVRDVCFDIWGEDDSWTAFTRYRLASLCKERDIDLLMDGSDIEMLEDHWFGIGIEGYDLSRLWARMEACSWPTTVLTRLAAARAEAEASNAANAGTIFRLQDNGGEAGLVTAHL